MEQVEGGDLVVNRGDESRPKEPTAGKRELNAVEGFDAALKLAQVSDIILPSSLSLTTNLRRALMRLSSATKGRNSHNRCQLRTLRRILMFTFAFNHT